MPQVPTLSIQRVGMAVLYILYLGSVAFLLDDVWCVLCGLLWGNLFPGLILCSLFCLLLCSQNSSYAIVCSVLQCAGFLLPFYTITLVFPVHNLVTDPKLAVNKHFYKYIINEHIKSYIQFSKNTDLVTLLYIDFFFLIWKCNQPR